MLRVMLMCSAGIFAVLTALTAVGAVLIMANGGVA